MSPLRGLDYRERNPPLVTRWRRITPAAPGSLNRRERCRLTELLENRRAHQLLPSQLRQHYALKLNSFAAVRPRMSAFSSSLSDVEAKIWSTGCSCQG